jgi:hypothetical protein
MALLSGNSDFISRPSSLEQIGFRGVRSAIIVCL